ncbi:MAG: DNA primase, partial [Mycoplasmatales bacterium]
MIDYKQKIINEINIVDIVAQYVELEKKGQNYNCICPFHDDTNPSLVVSEKKQIFKCFVCGEGGNAINFVQKYEKIPFKKALEKLATKTGISLPKKDNKNEKYFEILEKVKLFYNKILANSELATKANEYLLKERNLLPEDIKKFELGFSPLFSEALYQFLTQESAAEPKLLLELEQLALFNEKNFDFLQGRITIPLYNAEDELVGFSGRTLQQGNAIKYLNSKESVIFHKSSILYNFNNVIGNNNQELLVVEGYFDVITAVKKGIENVVATMGTAFNQEHIKLLKKYHITKVFLGFDSDKAGQKALTKAADLLIENKIEVEIITYEDYKDIDEYLNAKDVSKHDLLHNAQDYCLYLAEQNVNNNDLNKKAELINQICNYLNKYVNKVKVNLLIDKIVTILKVDKELLLTTLTNLRQKESNSLNIYPQEFQTKSQELVPTGKLNSEEQILYLITLKKENFDYVKGIIELNEFEFVTLANDYTKLQELYALQEEIDEVLLLDEITNYYQIYDKLKKDNYIKYFKTDNSLAIIKDLIYA